VVKVKVCIIGAGLTGISAARNLPQGSYIVFEKEHDIGGLCGSEVVNNFYFDYAPHAFFTSNQEILRLVKETLKTNIKEHIRRAYIYTYGKYVEYPLEVNLRKLPRDVAIECLIGVIKASTTPKQNPRNFREWMYAAYGEGIARHYLEPYNRKLWKYSLEDMSADWVIGRVPTPSIDDVIKGAFKSVKKRFGGNWLFYYPKVGGIKALVKALASDVKPVICNAEVTKIKILNGALKVCIRRGDIVKEYVFDKVINTSPLPDLVDYLEDVPSNVYKAAKELKHNKLITIGLGYKSHKNIRYHWVYYPEERYPFNRVSYPVNFSRYTVPKGYSSILVELTVESQKEMRSEEIVEEVEQKLKDARAIPEDVKIMVRFIKNIKYAYVIYDLSYKDKVRLVKEYLRERGIITAGRYGEWAYMNMDHAIQAGERAAQELINEVEKRKT